MHNKFSFIAMIILILILCSCNLNKNTDDSNELNTNETLNNTTEISTEITSNITISTSNKPLEVDYFAREIYDKDETSIILKDGVVSGSLKINFVEKLGIWDYNNSKANAAGVKYSYAINLALDMTEMMSDVDIATVLIEPVLYSSEGSIIGEKADVGWSGFSTSAELYTATPIATVEVNLQPLVQSIPDGAYLAFKVSDKLSGTLYDEIYYDLSVLTTAKKGASLLKISDTKKIKSINGGIFAFSILSAYYDNNQIDIDVKDEWGYFYDIKYHLNYLKKPKKGAREVANFDSFNSYKLNTSMVLGVNSDVDSTLLYYNTKDAARYLYADSDDVSTYVTTTKWPIMPKKTASLWINRLVPTSTTDEPTYIRIRVEFPEEAEARTAEELAEFNGRYLVYQIELSHRPLENEVKD